MSEEVKEMKDGSFLCVNEEGKAYWGQPEGYPYKEGETIHPIAPEFLPVVMVEYNAMNSTHNANVSELYTAAKSGKIVMCRGGVEIYENGQTNIEYSYGYFSGYVKNSDAEAAVFVSGMTKPVLITLLSNGTVTVY